MSDPKPTKSEAGLEERLIACGENCDHSSIRCIDLHREAVVALNSLRAEVERKDRAIEELNRREKLWVIALAIINAYIPKKLDRFRDATVIRFKAEYEAALARKDTHTNETEMVGR